MSVGERANFAYIRQNYFSLCIPKLIRRYGGSVVLFSRLAEERVLERECVRDSRHIFYALKSTQIWLENSSGILRALYIMW